MSIFTKVRMKRPRKNKFDLSHEKKLSMNMGNLTPILLSEVVPGDTFRCRTEIFARMAPMLAPIMHRVNVFTHFFFVPNRLVWNEWEDFITGGEDGEQLPVLPRLQVTTDDLPFWGIGGLPDYFGIPPTIQESSPLINALPFRAYQLIFNEYYRDQNLQDKVEFGLGGGLVNIPDTTALIQMRKRCWEKDYFTSALPWAQRGPEALIPMEADVEYLDTSLVKTASGGTPGSGDVTSLTGNLRVTGVDGRIENIENIENSSVTINDLRRSVRLQEWLEKNARGGARYIEQIMSHFGVKSSDARLQRPEYLGGGKSPITISEVLSTTEATDQALGEMGGHGISMSANHGFKRSFEEHGYVIGIMSVLPRTAYMNGVPRHLAARRRDDKFDYFWPEFANIGEQEIYQEEVQINGVAFDDDTVFGYTPRYAEYKYQPDTVHGVFRGSLDFWHMARELPNDVALNENFVKADPTKRIFAVENPTAEDMYVQVYHKFDAIRPMPYFGTPTL